MRVRLTERAPGLKQRASATSYSLGKRASETALECASDYASLRAATDIRLMVDMIKAPNVVRDLEGVRLLAGGSGELDKRADPKLSHISDALGYYVQRVFPTIRQGAVVQDLLIG